VARMMAILKIVVSGILIWAASELGKRSGKLGGLVLSLPITSIIAILWLWFETKDATKVANLASGTLTFILPSLLFFILLPILISRSVSFSASFAISILVTLAAYAIFFKIQNIA
jgi:hypothetical protein